MVSCCCKDIKKLHNMATLTITPYHTGIPFGNILNRIRPKMSCRAIIVTITITMMLVNTCNTHTPNTQPSQSKYLWVLDNGHGSLTKGRTSLPIISAEGDTTVLREWEFNRDIVRRIAEGLQSRGIRCQVLVPEVEIGNFVDGRVWRLNKMEGNDLRLISIHANAAGDGSKWHKANGREIFHLEGDKVGRQMAIILNKYMKDATPIRDRGIKTANFKVLKNTKCSAILSEEGFFTNKEEAALLMRGDMRQWIAEAHIKMICEFEGVEF